MRIVLLCITIMIAFTYFFVPSANYYINRLLNILTSMDIYAVAEYIRNFGLWAVTASFLLMILVNIVAPLPAFMITLANAAIFG